MALMKSFDYHAHIVNLVGSVASALEPAIVVEYCANGDLVTLLRRHRECLLTVCNDSASPVTGHAMIQDTATCKIEDPVCITRQDLVSFAWQISDGMVGLSRALTRAQRR